MLLFYHVKKYLIISLITVILDGLISYFIGGYFNNLNYFYPMLTISFIPFIYLGLKKKSYIFIIITGIIYDLLYSSIFLYNVILFFILINIDMKISECFKDSLLLFLLLSLFNIIFYDVIGFIITIIVNYQSITIYDLIYKINHSIILNIMSVFVFWFLCKNDKSHA